MYCMSCPCTLHKYCKLILHKNISIYQIFTFGLTQWFCAGCPMMRKQLGSLLELVLITALVPCSTDTNSTETLITYVCL